MITARHGVCLLAGAFAALTRLADAAACTEDAVDLPPLFGLEITEVSANEVRGFDSYSPFGLLPEDPVAVDFCNVTVTYTHPGLNDFVHVYVWLPLDQSNWNGRFIGEGGYGLAAGSQDALTSAVGRGYAAANTDAGHTFSGDPQEAIERSDSWALISPGNVNLVLLQNFAYRSLDDMTHIAKSVVKKYYGENARYAYWNGCSQGGRQGMALAQHYPDLYDGILAAAPAINFATFMPAIYHPHLLMKELRYHPAPCELNAITDAAIAACDELDGVKDGIVSAWDLCQFDALDIVGAEYECNGDMRIISQQAAEIANAIWNGPAWDDLQVWYGFNCEAMLTSPKRDGYAVATTSCKGRQTSAECKSEPVPLSTDWIINWIMKDRSFALANLTSKAFYKAIHTSQQEYLSIMDSSDPDLHAFQQSGGKLLSWHGLADPFIPFLGTVDYYQHVATFNSNVSDFFRLFLAPGVMHCRGGPGHFPVHAFDQLVEWVEHGVAPETLWAETTPATKGDKVAIRYICRYPLVPVYLGGDPDDRDSFACMESWDEQLPSEHGEELGDPEPVYLQPELEYLQGDDPELVYLHDGDPELLYPQGDDPELFYLQDDDPELDYLEHPDYLERDVHELDYPERDEL